MKVFVILFCLIAFSSNVFAWDVKHDCRSIIRIKSPKFEGYNEVAYLGPYYKKNQRMVGFLDQKAYEGIGFFHTRLVTPGNNIALGIRGTEAIGDPKNVVMLRYTPLEDQGVFPSELNIYQIVVFCSISEMAIEQKMSEYAGFQGLLVKPTSDLIQE